MSPELAVRKSEKSPSETAEDLRNAFESQRLAPKTPVEIATNQIMDSCRNDREGVFQFLLGVVKAGDSFFSIVDYFAIDKFGDGGGTEKGTLITKHSPNSRAEIVAFVNANERAVTVGRKHPGILDDLGDPTISREHFAVARRENTKETRLAIADLGSTNGTELFTAKNENDKWDNMRFWSVKSSELQGAIFGTDVQKR